MAMRSFTFPGEIDMSSIAQEPQTMTMFEWHASLIEGASDRVAFWIEKTRDDKVAWAPKIEGSCNTRSALEVGGECVTVNRRNAALFHGETPSEEEATFTNATDCARELRASGAELGAAIKKLTPASLKQMYQTRFGPMPGVVLLQISLGNLYYHGGQENMIQLLYGDPTCH